MENLDVYNKIKKVPEKAKKKITGGRLSGMTDIKPMWRIEKLTEIFGMCGVGWKAPIKNKEIIEGANGEKIAIVDIELFVKVDGKWSEAIEGTGGSSFISKEKNGLYTSDECFKMAYTDALSVACKSLGMGAEVYWGDSKYNTAEEPTLEEANNYVLTFGRHKGTKLADLDEGYINYLLANSTDAYVVKCLELLFGAKPITDENLPDVEQIKLKNQFDEMLIRTETDLQTVLKAYGVKDSVQLSKQQLTQAINHMAKKIKKEDNEVF